MEGGLLMPRVKIVKHPVDGRLGAAWDALEDVPEGAAFLEPAAVQFQEGDGSISTYEVKDMPLVVLEDETTKGLQRKLWAKNGGYPPGRTFVRGDSVEEMEVEMPKMKLPPGVEKRRRAVGRAGGAVEKQLMDAEVAEYRAEFDAWLEEQKRRGPG